MSCSSTVSESMSSLSTNLKTRQNHQSFHNEELNIPEARHLVDVCQKIASKEISQSIPRLRALFCRYGFYFDELVKQGTLANCFEPWMIQSIEQASGMDFTQI